MWATIPFLITMIVALLTITYVPALTEISASMSPYDPVRTGRVQDLASMVHTAAEELTVIREITLVDAAGKPLAGADGKPAIKHLNDCDAIKDEIAKGGCQKVFFDVKACKGQADEAACSHKAIAAWIVANLNAGDDVQQQIVVVTEVPLVNSDGKPLKDKSGTPIVKKLADCATATDPDTCRELFLNVSNCKITSPDAPDSCIQDKVSTWADSNASDAAP